MSVPCDKCGKVFISKYNLEKHLNKIISCDANIQCDKCKKIFKSNRDLDNHLNKKIQCVTTPLKSINFDNDKIFIKDNKLEYAKLQFAEKEINIKIQLAEIDNATKIQLAKNDNAAKIQLKMLDLEIAKVKNITMELEIALKDKEHIQKIELIKIKEESNLVIIRESETLKTERKEITPYVIENSESIKVDSETIKRISGTYLETSDSINLTKDFMEQSVITNILKNNASDIIKKNPKISNTNFMLLAIILNNNEYPQFKNIFYIKDNKEYYGIVKTIDGTLKEAKKIPYDSYVFQLVKMILIKSYNFILTENADILGKDPSSLDKFLNILNIIDDKLKILINMTPKSEDAYLLRDLSDKVFDENNSI